MLVRALKLINSLPVPLTIRHYVSYGVSSGKLSENKMRGGDDWVVLRDTNPWYRMAEDRETWLAELALDGRKDGQDPGLLDRVKSFAALLAREGIETVYSIGSGGGVFEYYLKKEAPQLRVIATECTDEGVARLKRVFTECDEVRYFDALDAESWKDVARRERCVAFMYRNEREFTDRQWKKMFADMHAAGVPRVFFGMMYTLTILGGLMRFRKNLGIALSGGTLSFGGYLRSFAALRAFWEGKYRVKEEISFPLHRGIYLEHL